MVNAVAQGPYTVAAFFEAYKAAQEVFNDGIAELLIGLLFSALAGTTFYAITRK